MDRSFAMGNGQSTYNGPGQRPQWGYPPPAVTSWTLTGWEAPE